MCKTLHQMRIALKNTTSGTAYIEYSDYCLSNMVQSLAYGSNEPTVIFRSPEIYRHV